MSMSGSGRAEYGRIILSYSVRQNGSDWEPITQTVNTTQSDCNYGGQRTYFLCPGVVNGRHCGRRVGKLFSGGRYFFCRHCYNITYSSQSEARYDRMLRRANKLRTALAGEPGAAHLMAFKPKGMWQRTQLINGLRGMVAEFGVYIARGLARVIGFAEDVLMGEVLDLPEIANEVIHKVALRNRLEHINLRL